MAESQVAFYKQLNCPICLETFESPKVLACLHTFCEKCICKHACSFREVRTESDIITCPVCRTAIPAPAPNQTPDEWAAKLATNSIVLALLASIQSSKDEDESVCCQPCLTLGKKNLSAAYCVTCSEYICNICYTYHKSFKMSKDHSITLQSVHAQQNWNSSQSDMYCCPMHEEQYKYFCKNHEDLCCSDCAIKDHRKCEDLLLIKDLSKGNKEVKDNEQISEKLDAVKKMFITLLESRSQNLESIEQQKIAITKSIQDWTTTIKELLDRLQTAALEKLDQMCKEEAVTISDQTVECKSAIAAIKTSEEILMGSRKLEDDTKMFITTTKVSCQVLKYLERYKTLENNTENVELEFHLDSTCEGIIKTVSSIGKLTRRIVKIPKILSDSSFAATKMPKIQPNSMVTFCAKIHDETKCDICSGVFLLDERLVLCDWANHTIKLFNRYFQFVSHLNVKNSPRDICCVDEGTVAVTVYGDDIHIVSVTNKLTLLRNISVGQLCYGIASYQQNIIVATHGNERSLLTYDTSDKIINVITSIDSLTWHNTHCVSHDEQRIYYTKQNAVVIMNMKGNKINIFESNDLKNASGITTDKQGIVYCCGKESQTVIQLHPEGRQLGILLSHENNLKKPVGICLNNMNDTILVFEENSNDVKVFKLI